MTWLRTIFVFGTLAWAGLSLWLSFRQSRYVELYRDQVPGDFAASCTLEEHRKAADYTQARERLARWETLFDAALALAWAFGGIDLVYRLASSATPPSLGRGVLFLLATGLVGAILSAPFDIYRTFRIEQAFGFNRTTPRQFIMDGVKRGLLALVLFAPLLFGLLFVMREASGLWWLWAWLGLLVIMSTAPGIYVRFIAPRFNKFEPLADGSLRTGIEGVLQRAGFRSSGLFTMDASKRTAHGNAYFIGFGRAKRIVLFDTLIARSAQDEIEAVVAHELGHFLHRHVVFGLLRGAAILFAALCAFGWLTKQAWLLPAFGVAHRDDALSLYVCLLLGSLVGPVAALFGNWISRKNEYQADDYARTAVGADPLVRALTRLSRDNASTLTPDPLYSLVHHSHPTVALRIRRLRASASAERQAAV